MSVLNSGRLALLLPFILAFMHFGCRNPETKNTNQEARPNILLIVADDMGFSDIGAFGGNIQTPRIDGLAKEGLSFSNYYVLPTCSPSRSAMLTGNDNHIAGLGIMEEVDYPVLHNQQLAGYSGHLSDQVVTIPEILRGNGYHTYMTGKWHLGEGEGKDPYDRGFEETFTLGTGGGSHWNDRKALAPPQHMIYSRNGREVEPPQKFYSTKDYTDSMIQFIEKNKNDNQPFFAFLSYTAVHDPLHAPKEYIDKYKGKFDIGWDSLFTIRMENLKALGIIPRDIKGFNKNPLIPKWETLDKKQKEDLARDMEVYAAMLDYLDMSIGRVLDYLKMQGLLDNTLIIFMSDNGANGAIATTYPGNEDGRYLGSFNNALENRGLQNSFIETGPGWAQASSSPFRFFKTFTSEGGIKSPLIIKMPGQMKLAGQRNKGFAHVTDIMPTILEITGSVYPKQFKNKNIHPYIGKSLIPVLKGDSLTVHTNDGMGWELFEMKAYVKGNWKILRLPRPFGTGQWQLFDLSQDPGETSDLSGQFPDVFNQLIQAWNEYARNNEVFDHHGHFDSIYQRSFLPERD